MVYFGSINDLVRRNAYIDHTEILTQTMANENAASA